MTRLQKAPFGILGAFDLKNMGENPAELSDTVVLVADVYDQYLADGQQVLRTQGTIANPATFGNVVFTVPQGKVWRLLNASIAAVFDVADAALTTHVDFRLASDPNNTTVTLLEPTGVMTRGGSTLRGAKIAKTYSRPLFMPSGWTVNATVQLDAAPAVSFVFDAAILVQEFDA